MSEAKPYRISKQEVWKAYEKVKANQGAAGVDEQSIEDFDKKLKDNLYKIWNRMSSGSYFPPPVLAVEIDKDGGGKRKLGIPTVSDRMRRKYPHLPFERYADDLIVHCRTEMQAQEVRAAIALRMQECRLELHPEKTKIVYCKDDDRRRTHPQEKFTFLGYTFRPRRSKNSKNGKFFINFSPAIAEKASKAIRDEIRRWKLPKRSDKSLDDLSRMFNPKIRGWFQYYGRYYRSALYPLVQHLNRLLALWAKRKYKKLRGHFRRARHWIARISRRDPQLFAHWQMGVRRGSAAGAV